MMIVACKPTCEETTVCCVGEEPSVAHVVCRAHAVAQPRRGENDDSHAVDLAMTTGEGIGGNEHEGNRRSLDLAGSG